MGKNTPEHERGCRLVQMCIRDRLETSGFKLDPRVRVNEPLGFNDYNKLQMNALAIVSDSGTLPEESSFYLSSGHPIAAVCIRTSTERPEALEAGDFILAGITTEELLGATSMAIEKMCIRDRSNAV